jgi:hypothetical protein
VIRNAGHSGIFLSLDRQINGGISEMVKVEFGEATKNHWILAKAAIVMAARDQ